MMYFLFVLVFVMFFWIALMQVAINRQKKVMKKTFNALNEIKVLAQYQKQVMKDQREFNSETAQAIQGNVNDLLFVVDAINQLSREVFNDSILKKNEPPTVN